MLTCIDKLHNLRAHSENLTPYNQSSTEHTLNSETVS